MIDIVPIEDVKRVFKSKLIEHHTKYKEIHGEDKTVFIRVGKHVSIHRRLRKEGKCNISPKELHEISENAFRRTEKYHDYRSYCVKGDTYDKCYKCENLDKCIRDAKR
jgi:hypothetical protein